MNDDQKHTNDNSRSDTGRNQNNPGLPEPVTSPFIKDDASHDSEEPASPPQPKRRSSKGLLIGGGIVAALALGAGSYFLATAGDTGSVGPMNATSEYVLINDAGQLDCSNLSEIPAFHDLDPVPNEYADDGVVKVRPDGTQSAPSTVCEFASDRSGGLIQIHTYSPEADACSISGDTYNEDWGWDGWYTSTSTSEVSGISEIPGIDKLTITATTITFAPTSGDEGMGCATISGFEGSSAQQDYLDQVAEIIYENTPQA